MNPNLNDNEFDELIRGTLLSVSAPAELREKLLRQASEAPAPQSRPWHAFISANDGIFRRMLPVAACLVVALGIAFWSTGDSQTALGDEIFTHMYLEGQLDNANADVLPLETVNARLKQWMGAHLDVKKGDKDLDVTFAKDCWVAKQAAFHIIMKGETGAVTVMMIPDREPIDGVDREFNISDATFSGLVTPTERGYLVVIGNKREPLTAYRNLLTGRLEWEY
ncbi:MAG: DUF3379 family protein [Pseudomonadota bacterium]|nr:DUF3379 family protein [Pseudomonadota bacterium]